MKQSPYFHQMTWEELIYGLDTQSYVINGNTANTRTYLRERIPYSFLSRYNYERFKTKVLEIQEEYKDVYECEDMHTWYHTYHIPKKSHGFRQIDAPQGRLKEAQYKLKDEIERFMCCDSRGVWSGATYHTSAFAYMKKRGVKKCAERHQKNGSNWFSKFDFSNFFGSTTMEFLIKQLRMILPFACVDPEFLKKALKIAFLDGGLPQGTPLSPMLTNIMMIPIDFELNNTLRHYNHQTYVYTRYADDLLISSEFAFKFREIESVIRQTLEKFEAPFEVKPEKTRYGSRAGSNWILGMMLNKDNELTIGHKEKNRFKAALTNYVMDSKNDNRWEIGDVQVLNGKISHYRYIEGDKIDDIIKHISEKFHRDIKEMIKCDLKGVPYSVTCVLP